MSRSVYSILLAFCCLFITKGFVDELRRAHSADFRPVYSGSRCLLKRCNPYNSQDLDRVFVEAGGPTPNFRQGSANYPPTTFFALLPIAFLSWPAGHIVWLVLIAISMCVAIMLATDLAAVHWWIFAIACGMFLVTQRWLLSGGQPSGIAISFCVIAVWCLLKNRYVKLGVVLFALSLAIKPQIGALIWVYFALSSSYRRRALQIFAGVLVMGFPGVAWVTLMKTSRHWFHEEAAVVRWIEHRSDQVQGVVFCECTHLQPLLGHFALTAASAQIIAWGIWSVLFVWWLFGVYRLAPSKERDILCIAAAACLTLIPVYHGEYDSCLLFLLFPASAQLLGVRRKTGISTVVLAFIILFLYLVRTFPFQVKGLGGIARFTQAHGPLFETNALILIGIVVLLNQSTVPMGYRDFGEGKRGRFCRPVLSRSNRLT